MKGQIRINALPAVAVLEDRLKVVDHPAMVDKGGTVERDERSSFSEGFVIDRDVLEFAFH